MALSKFVKVPGTCEEHGNYEGIVFRGQGPFCPTCVENQRKEDEAKRKEELYREWAERKAAILLGRAAIPPRFADRRLDNFAPHAEGPAAALAIAKQFVAEFDQCLETGRSLIFCGGVGSGKTHLSVGICHGVIALGRMAVFTSVLTAIRSIKETYRKGSETTEAQAIERLIEPDLLVLDEVGVQFGSETEKMYLFEVINGRYEQLRPTIVISNLAKDALTEYLGERVVDRLREGGGRMVIFDWPSYRRIAR
ncbi:DNA replication protein DnaC [Bordetella genomosp. 9]|uniref:DNA replication protein DnaC n=2 Tax=Bordetella genomosp. 9 TaxID=1416803 RepID=A0A1W6Z690_9BORD|nr:DNA replication protein DnaC [Bordetella genomosp. 9]